MTGTQKATPRPWHIGKPYGRINRHMPIYPDTPTIGQLVVCEAGGEDVEANAALIVTAVNAYDAMREIAEAAREVQAARRGYIAVTHGNANRYDVDQKVSAADKRLDAALAAAEGKVE